MTSNPSERCLAPGLMAAVLPADGATLALALSGDLMLVAHTGGAHLGVPVDRALYRGLARAQGLADRAFYGSQVRERAASAPVPADTDPPVAFVGSPGMIPVRHATSHSFAVSGPDIHLTLQAARDSRRPEVQVELRLDLGLIAQLAQHQHQLRRRARARALAAFLVAFSVFVALVAFTA